MAVRSSGNADDVPSPRPQRGSSESTDVVTAYVVEPGGPCNRYRWDADTGAPVLQCVLHPATPRGVDLARIPLLPLSHRAHEDSPRRRTSWIEPLFDESSSELFADLGPSLLALVLAQPPNPPGTQLSVRLLGAAPVIPSAANVISYEGTLDDLLAWVAVAVPAADPTLAQVERVSDLPDDLRLRLERALAGIAPSSPSVPQNPDVWITADHLMAGYREARAHGRLVMRATEVAARGQLRERLFSTSATEAVDEAFRRRLATDAVPAALEPASAWREITPISLAELRARGTAVFGEADQLIRWIPTRFARYLGELLLPQERVLFFAECPPLTLRGWSGTATFLMNTRSGTKENGKGNRRPAVQGLRQAFGRLCSRHLQSGILIITDQQVLLLRDFAAPDASMVQWGYVAHSWPLGRLVAVSTLAPGIALDDKALASWPPSVRNCLAGVLPYDEATAPTQHARLILALEGAGGIQLTGGVFPTDMAPVLERSADLLSSFLPWPGAAGAGDRRVRLVPIIEPWKPTDQEVTELASLGGLVAPALTEALDTATNEALHPGEIVLAQARAPRTSDAQPHDATLLTVTPERLLIATGSGTAGATKIGPAALRVLALGSVTTTTLQHSLLGCVFSITLPGGDAADMQRLIVGFPSPLIVPFRALFTRLRLLVGGSPVRR